MACPCSHLTSEGSEPTLGGGTCSLLCARHPERWWGLWGDPGMVGGGYVAGLGGAVGSEDGNKFLPSSGRVLWGQGCQEPEVNVVTRDHG